MGHPQREGPILDSEPIVQTGDGGPQKRTIEIDGIEVTLPERTSDPRDSVYHNLQSRMGRLKEEIESSTSSANQE